MFGGEDAEKEQRASVRTMDDGQRICAFFVKEQRADEGCSFMDENRFCNCNYTHMDKSGRITKKG